MANLGARKRVYEILTKISRGEDLKISSKNFSTNNEMVELVELLTNNSPFIDIESVKVQYAELLNGNQITPGQYYHNHNIIEYSTVFLELIANNRMNIMDLFNVVFHEQTHHYQNRYREHSHLINTIDFKKIVNDLYDGYTSEELIKELNNFAHKHKLLGKKLTKRRLKTLQFGAYLSNHCEVDARQSAYQTTSKVYEIMINDPECPAELKKYLTNKFKLFIKDKEKEQASFKKKMKGYENLNKRVEEILLKSIRSGEKLDSKNKTVLLNGMLNHITKSLTLKENFEIAKWALENNYKDLVDQINLKNSISSQKRDLSHFITDLLSDNVLTADNFGVVCTLFSSFEREGNKEAIDYLVANLVDRAEVKILLENCSIGRGESRKTDKYISPDAIEVALKIYLSRVENSKNIENYEEYREIEQDIRNRLNARGLGVNVEETQKLFEPILARFDKINNNKKIKINGEVQQQEQTIEPLHNIKSTIEEMLKDKDVIKEINYDERNSNGKSDNVYLSGKLIGEVYRYAIIHQSQETIKIEDVIDYIQEIRQLHLDTYSDEFKDKPKQEKNKYIEAERSKIVAKSIAEKLNIDCSSYPSVESQEKIKDYFIKNYVEDGYVFHSFPYARKESVERDGFTKIEKLWDNEKVSEVVKIFEDKGVIKALGGYGFYDEETKENFDANNPDSKRKIYVEHNPEAIFFHELSAPEWFKIFTSSSHSLTSEDIKTMPFFVKNYDACKQNVKDLCNNAGLTLEEKEKVGFLFKECWKTLGKPELVTALIPRKKVGKDNVSKEIENMDFLETISYISTDGARDFIEHVGNVVDAEDINGNDISIVETPPADRYFVCENFTRETKEQLYDPAKNIASIYKGIVLSNGNKTITQDQYNKVFNKIEDTFADNPNKLEEIKGNWIKFDKSIQHSALDSKKQDEVVSNFRNMETTRQELNVQQSIQPTTPPPQE